MLSTYEMIKNSLTNYKAPDIKIKRMSDNGEIIKLTKNLYETDKNISGHLVANAIYSPSYLSFDYALAYHGLIPEAVYVYTSATYKKKKKKEYHNSLGVFTYRDVPENVYPYGIEIIIENERSYTIATPEKALCDKLYTIKPIHTKNEMYELLFNDLRIDSDSFKNLNYHDLICLCNMYKSTNMKTLMKVINDFSKNKSRTKNILKL